jgi:hypothetical protein
MAEKLSVIGTLEILVDGTLILDAPVTGNPVKALSKGDAVRYFGTDKNTGWYIVDENGKTFITSDRSYVTF